MPSAQESDAARGNGAEQLLKNAHEKERSKRAEVVVPEFGLAKYLSHKHLVGLTHLREALANVLLTNATGEHFIRH